MQSAAQCALDLHIHGAEWHRVTISRLHTAAQARTDGVKRRRGWRRCCSARIRRALERQRHWPTW